jgi:hypothetical protein
MDTWSSLALAFFFGALGGLGFGLLQDKGLEIPSIVVENNKRFWDAGFFGEVLIGAIAGMLTYAISHPSGELSIIATALPAGIGGTAILRSYMSGRGATALKAVAEEAIDINENIVRRLDVVGGVAAGNRSEAGPIIMPLDEDEIELVRGRVDELRQNYNRVLRRWRIR